MAKILVANLEFIGQDPSIVIIMGLGFLSQEKMVFEIWTLGVYLSCVLYG